MLQQQAAILKYTWAEGGNHEIHSNIPSPPLEASAQKNQRFVAG
jgi:hypothetical protein